MKPLVIIGCGGFGREVLDVVEAINRVQTEWEVVGFVDDNASDVNQQLVERRGLRVVGTVDELISQRDPGWFTIGIGSPAVRRALDAKLCAANWKPATLVHPTVTMGGDVEIGEGAVICAGVRMTTHITLGRHVHLNLNTTIGHDCTIGDFVSVNPLVAVSGWVHLADEVTLGTHSAILQNLSVGEGSTVGGAALVVKDVPEGVVVKGVPAR